MMNCSVNQERCKRAPLQVYLQVNNRCRFKCNHCQGKSTHGVCTDFVLDDILGALAVQQPLQIMWCGGEPLLSPRLAEYVTGMVDLGHDNIVCTNMTVEDPLGMLAGRFVYQVTLHGVDPLDFRQTTGWDLFNDFQRHFKGLFKTGHLVDVQMVITADWREYLEHRLRWVENYPVRCFRIVDGRNPASTGLGHYSIQDADLVEMKELIADISPKLRVVLPVIGKHGDPQSFIISPVSDGSAFCKINNINLVDQKKFVKMLNIWINLSGSENSMK